MTTYGTSHFVSIEKAIRYYMLFTDDAASTVMRKICEGEIHIGQPTLKPGQTISVIDSGTRYAITEEGA